jgi:hypothetical protein
MAKLEFFYDCSSPWTYLAFTKIEEVANRHRAELIWKPILVGGLFNTVNPSVYENRAKPVPVKAKYYTKDLRDWANFYGLKIGNPTVFPVNSVKAMRGAFVALEHLCEGASGVDRQSARRCAHRAAGRSHRARPALSRYRAHVRPARSLRRIERVEDALSLHGTVAGRDLGAVGLVEDHETGCVAAREHEVRQCSGAPARVIELRPG